VCVCGGSILVLVVVVIIIIISVIIIIVISSCVCVCVCVCHFSVPALLVLAMLSFVSSLSVLCVIIHTYIHTHRERTERTDIY